MRFSELVRSLCIENNWCTGADNEAYQKLLDACDSTGSFTLRELAVMIWMVSDATLEDVLRKLTDAANAHTGPKPADVLPVCSSDRPATLVITATTEHNETILGVVKEEFQTLVEGEITAYIPSKSLSAPEIAKELKESGMFECSYFGEPPVYEEDIAFRVVFSEDGSPFGTEMAQFHYDNDDVLERINTTYIRMPDGYPGRKENR